MTWFLASRFFFFFHNLYIWQWICTGNLEEVKNHCSKIMRNQVVFVLFMLLRFGVPFLTLFCWFLICVEGFFHSSCICETKETFQILIWPLDSNNLDEYCQMLHMHLLRCLQWTVALAFPQRIPLQRRCLWVVVSNTDSSLASTAFPSTIQETHHNRLGIGGDVSGCFFCKLIAILWGNRF